MSVPFIHDLTPAQLRAHQANTATALELAPFFHDMPLAATQHAQQATFPELALIPPGTFAMGNADPNRLFGERPESIYTLNQPFALGVYCVTADQFEQFTQATGHVWADHLLRTEGRQPVTNVDRNDALAYVNWLSAQTGQRYRLPTEAEWEYAARAGSSTAYCFGDDLGCSTANTGSFRLQGRNARGWQRFLPFCAPSNQALDVGCYPANLWGLYDMHGNVWEFTQDEWEGAVDLHHIGKQRKNGTWFVTKGGSWFDAARFACSYARKPRRADELDTNMGFRVLREIV